MNRGFWIWAVNALNESELKARMKRFGLRVMKLVDALPNTMAGRAIGSQLVRSGPSVGADAALISRRVLARRFNPCGIRVPVLERSKRAL